MANMTRTQLRAELTARGWSRYTNAQLDRYLDWGLQAVRRAFKWKDTGASVDLTKSGNILLSEVAATSPRGITGIFCVSEGKELKLEPMPDDRFYDAWYSADPSLSGNQSQPTHYYIHNDEIFLLPFPDQSYDFRVNYLARQNVFAADGSTSGLPEFLDSAILLEAEAYCFQRAHEFERMAIAQGEARRIVFEEVGDEGGRMAEDHGRVIPYR